MGLDWWKQHCVAHDMLEPLTNNKLILSSNCNYGVNNKITNIPVWKRPTRTFTAGSAQHYLKIKPCLPGRTMINPVKQGNKFCHWISCHHIVWGEILHTEGSNSTVTGCTAAYDFSGLPKSSSVWEGENNLL